MSAFSSSDIYLAKYEIFVNYRNHIRDPITAW